MQQSAPRKTLLIVEDDDMFRERLGRSMEGRGMEVQKTDSVRDARVLIERRVPDYAIVDLRLSDGSGLAVVEALARSDAKSRPLVLTGYGDIPTAVAAVRAGAIDYITKPATADDVLEALMTQRDERPPPPAKPIHPEAARWQHIQHVYREADENISRAARLLRMHRRTLQRIIKRHGKANEPAS